MAVMARPEGLGLATGDAGLSVEDRGRAGRVGGSGRAGRCRVVGRQGCGGRERGTGGAEADEGGDRFQPGPPGSFLVAAQQQRRQPQPPAHQERSRPRRSA